ncbi:E3 ubiquitin- ligase DTX3L, partial [Paramuricea clavata]
ASTHASPERVSNAWLADGSVLHNSTHRKYRSRNENKWLRKGARQKKINTCRGLTPGQATTLKSPFNETKVKLNDDLVKKMHKKAELKEIVEKGEVKLDTKGGYLTGTWNAIHAVGQRLISILSGSDQTENNYDTANNFTFSSTINDQPGASPEAIDPSTVTDQPAGTLSTPQSKQPDESFTVSLLFLRYIMAYHYEVFLKLESVCKEISFEVKSKTERNLKLTPREDVDPNKFSKAVNKFIDFYQVQNQKMLQQDIAKLPKDKMDVLSEARTKFSVVIDSAQELDKITIYGEKDNVEEAYRFFQSKVGVLNPGPGSSSSSKGKTANVALSETFSSDLSENLKLVVYQGDLTKENVDAIVNPANDHLQHGGGAAGAIVKAGGRSIQDESDDIMRKRGKRPLQPGEVELTAGGRLPCKFVVHAVGPVWNRHPPNTAMQLLANAVFNSLCLACRNGARSISIPAIGSGLYQVPVDVCARVLFETVVHFASKADKSSSLEEIHFVNIDSSTNRKFVQEMEKRFHGSLKREKVETSLSHNTKEQERQTQIGQQRMAFTTTKSETNSDRGRTTNVTHRGSNHNNHIGDNKGARPPDDKPLLLSYAGAAAGKNTDTDHDSKPGADNKTSKYDECSICLSGFTKKKSLDKCGHSFCTKCIDKAFEVKKQCPICSMVYGPLTGNQPKGNMYDSFQSTSLPGFKSCGTIVISYRFPSGIQCQDHPHPGKPYTGTSRTAYLPDNKEGRKVLKLLQKAFQQKLTFTIGRSTTTGRDDCVTWNDIHHKTSEYGGSTGYGYPDPDYLKRVKDELAAKGIRE